LRVECPGTEMYQLLFGGQLTPEQQGPLADHAATCPTCHAVVEAMVTQHGPAHTEPRPLTVGSVIGGRFRIDQVLGAGGMGIVVAATHTELGNRVAIKFMRDEKLKSAEAIERFIREARAVVKLRTEHVCRVHDVARLDTGAPYIVMELLQGVDLARAIASRPLPATIAVEYVMQAAVALAEAHAAGIVHRDLKPANLFVTRRHDGGPLVKVLDFGIAKALTESDARLTRTRAMLGSPGYISPEQLDSPRDVDGRSDIWALGVTLYQLLSGRLPFWGKNATEIAVKIAAEDPPPLEVDPPLAAVVLRCLEKSADDRYQDVAALAAELVPFGGPRARTIVAAIAQTASVPVLPTPAELRAVPLHAATGATGATGAIAPPDATSATGAITTIASRPAVAALRSLAEAVRPSAGRGQAAGLAAGLAAGSSSSQPRRAPRWQLAVAAVAGVAAVVAIAITVRGLVHRGDEIAAAPSGPGAAVPASPPASAPAVAPPSSPTGPLPPPPGAGMPDAGVAPSAPGPAPRQAEPARGSAGPPTPLSSFAAERQRCDATLDPGKAASLPSLPSLIVKCWCQSHDTVHARAAFGWLASPRDRELVRRACKKDRIEL